MSSSTVNKVVLKSNTTMTLSDRFSDIMKMKASPKMQVQLKSPKAEQTKLAQASAKNKRLAEQMARRSTNAIEPDDDPSSSDATKITATKSIKSRLGAVKKLPTKARLGIVTQTGISPSRLGTSVGMTSRGQGLNSPRLARGRSSSTRGLSIGGRGKRLLRQGQGSFVNDKTRRTSWSGKSDGTRGRGQGQRGRGRGRGVAGVGKATREDLDKELDSYMDVKKNHLSFD
eukprot:gene2470-2844_t